MRTMQSNPAKKNQLHKQKMMKVQAINKHKRKRARS